MIVEKTHVIRREGETLKVGGRTGITRIAVNIKLHETLGTARQGQLIPGIALEQCLTLELCTAWEHFQLVTVQEKTVVSPFLGTKYALPFDVYVIELDFH